MSSFLSNSEFETDSFLMYLSYPKKAPKLYRMYTACLEYMLAVVKQTDFLSSIIQVKLSSTSTLKRVKYTIMKGVHENIIIIGDPSETDMPVGLR